MNSGMRNSCECCVSSSEETQADRQLGSRRDRRPTWLGHYSLGLGTLAILCAVATPTRATELRDIELRRLFEPTPAEIRAEQSGRIFIYEGLRDVDVARAMREEFDRVDAMMFIREQITNDDGEVKKDPETGTPVYQDDGC